MRGAPGRSHHQGPGLRRFAPVGEVLGRFHIAPPPIRRRSVVDRPRGWHLTHARSSARFRRKAAPLTGTVCGSVGRIDGTRSCSAGCTASVRVPCSKESQVRPGRRVVGIPDLGVGGCDEGPYLLHPTSSELMASIRGPNTTNGAG